MTNLGMKIVGDELEVGFTVSSREEFDTAVARLQTVAATIWIKWHEPEPDPQFAPEKALDHPVFRTDAVGSNYAHERKAAAVWREDQGLR